MVSIRVQNLPGVKTSRLPAGVSSRGDRINNLHMGKQMMAGYPAGAPINGNVWLPLVGIVKSAQEWAGGSPRQGVPLRCLSGMR